MHADPTPLHTDTEQTLPASHFPLGQAATGFAALIAVLAWLGLGLQFLSLLERTQSVVAALWVLLGYFTITTNLVVATVFSGIALRRPGFAAPGLVGGTTLAIMLVGVVYALLLRGHVPVLGDSLARTANMLMHDAIPALVPLFWLLFMPKGRLRGHDPLIWAIYPLVYLAYALLRGEFGGRYAYPFIDVATIGWARTGLNTLGISAGFLLVAFALVRLDTRLAPAGKDGTTDDEVAV